MVTIMPLVVGALSGVPKYLHKGLEELEIGGMIGTKQISVLTSARNLRIVLKT